MQTLETTKRGFKMKSRYEKKEMIKQTVYAVLLLTASILICGLGLWIGVHGHEYANIRLFVF